MTKKVKKYFDIGNLVELWLLSFILKLRLNKNLELHTFQIVTALKTQNEELTMKIGITSYIDYHCCIEVSKQMVACLVQFSEQKIPLFAITHF